METEEAIKIDCAARADPLRRTRDRDVRTQPVVRTLAMRHDDVQCVGGATLEQADQRLASRRSLERGAIHQLRAECRAPEEARAQTHRHEGKRTGFHEDSTVHWNAHVGVMVELTTLELRRTDRQPDDLRQPGQLHRPR